MVGRIDAAPPEALASPDASRRFVGAITDETILATSPLALERKNCRGAPIRWRQGRWGYIPLGQGGTDLLARHELYTDD